MGTINTRNGKLVADFRYQNQRCREQTQLNDSLSIFFMTVFGSTNDTISFSFFDPISKNILSAQNTIVFKPGEIWGTPSNPY